MATSNDPVLLDCIVKVLPPSTINGWVNNSLVTSAVNAADLIDVIALFNTVTTGVDADVTSELLTQPLIVQGGETFTIQSSNTGSFDVAVSYLNIKKEKVD